MYTSGKRKTKGWGSALRARIMSLFMILCLVMSSVVSAPVSRAASQTADEKIWESEESGYRLEASQTSAWEGGYTAEITVRNTGKEELRNWSVTAELLEGDIENAWNAGVKKIGKQVVVFESEQHNMIIPSGEKAVFGFKVTGGSFTDLLSLKLVPGKILNTSRADMTFKETGSWDGHKIMEGTITNQSGRTIRDWSLSFEMEGKIVNIWNAEAAEECGSTFHLKNCGYNGVLKPGECAVFGFQVAYDTEAFSGIHNVRIFAGDQGTGGEDVKPTETQKPTPTAVATAVPATEVPTATAAPEPAVTPSVSEKPGEQVSEEDIQFIQVENRDWNMDMIHANDPAVQAAKRKADRKIRVTMLDSGINYSDEVEVVQRRNFVEGQDEMSCLFEDGSGHGTAIAEILASDPKAAYDDSDGEDDFGTYTYCSETDNDDEDDDGNEDGETIDAGEAGKVSMGDLLDSGYEWTEGVNPNIELFSGKVLDEENETTVDRVVEGIEWAIENETDILSLSLGMDKDSEKLHRAVKKAAESGMLIIAAVGEDEKTDYPAAYPEVMAVGMVNSMGETAGVRSEVCAPGDFILSRGVFDSMQVFSGSSMAVPHVAGLASILWQQDTTKAAAFIRGLIDVSANRRPEEEGGYGLIDCRYALDTYEEFEEQVRREPGLLDRISRNRNPEKVKEEVAGTIDNETEVETDEEMEKLHGSWESELHKQFVSKKYRDKWTNGKKYVRILQRGLSFVDKADKNPECYGMRDHPWFHGFYGGVEKTDGSGGKTPRSNYMTSFRTLLELAEGMRRQGEIKDISTESSYPAVESTLKGIKKAFRDKDKVGSQSWKDIDENCGKQGGSIPKDCRSLLIYGMALHTLGDTFSHSSFGLEKVVPKKKSQNKDKVIAGKVKWKRYAHGSDKKGEWYADNTKSRKLRYQSAKAATKAAIKKIQVDPEKGLAGYENYGSAVEAFCPKKQFSKLKEMFVTVKDKTGKKVKIPKIQYLEEGYALRDFANSYEKEVKITGRTSKDLEKYLAYVDQELLKDRFKKCGLLKIKRDQKMSMDKNSTLKVKVGGKTILDLLPKGDSIFLLLPEDLECQVENTKSQGTNTICTIEGGVLYDEIGRKMRYHVPEDSEELDEEEEMKLCDLRQYEMSTDCLVKGKVVYFDYTVGSASKENMPGLGGVNIRFRSRDTGDVYNTKSKIDGAYQIEVPAGRYDVTYEKGEKYTVVNQSVAITSVMDLYKNTTIELIDEEWFGEGYLDAYLYDGSTGGPLAGAEVRIYEGVECYHNAPVHSVKTDVKGYFSTGFLSAGAYTIVVSKEGYSPLSIYGTVIGNIRGFMSKIILYKREG
ncbi:MAG: S8 family serine peptidase [Eubacterium sp.]|nr:S8 family serine peptidase [Eubacterium sp.]